MTNADQHRDSEIGEPDLIIDPHERALAESRNALRQFEVGMQILEKWFESGALSRLRISDLLLLNRVVLEGINRFAGTFRATPIKIRGSSHQPPDPTQVPIFTEDFCDYINLNTTKSAVHLAAFALWRLNWIHPFSDGNGRTARMISYMLLCRGLGYRIPGTRTIPEQIAEDKLPYYHALEEADAAFIKGRIDVSAVERLLEEKLAQQLLQIHHAATAFSDSSAKPVGLASAARINTSNTIAADVEYLRSDGLYRPVYLITLPDAAATSSTHSAAPASKSWAERNAPIITATATVIAALIAAMVAIAVAFRKV